MAYQLKTQRNDASVHDFLKTIENETKRSDSLQLLEIFERISGYKGEMWGKSIIGFGTYTYTNTTGKPYTWMRIGFSPRKAYISLYIMPGYQFDTIKDLLKKLGKHKISKGSCLYINRLSDIDISVLEEMIEYSLEVMKEKYG